MFLLCWGLCWDWRLRIKQIDTNWLQIDQIYQFASSKTGKKEWIRIHSSKTRPSNVGHVSQEVALFNGPGNQQVQWRVMSSCKGAGSVRHIPEFSQVPHLWTGRRNNIKQPQSSIIIYRHPRSSTIITSTIIRIHHHPSVSAQYTAPFVTRDTSFRVLGGDFEAC